MEGVSGTCLLTNLVHRGESHFSGESHFIGIIVYGPDRVDTCRVHVTFSILDTDDKTLKTLDQVCDMGINDDRVKVVGIHFTPTAEEKTQSVHADGNIRLRAVVNLFTE